MNALRLPTSLRNLRFSSRIALFRFRDITTAANKHAAIQEQHISTAIAPPTAEILPFSSTTLNSYQVAIPPEREQLRQAQSFFSRAPPAILFSASRFLDLPPSSFPEVAFLGRSNVGKSSLLNALLGRPKERPAHVSSRPGRTRVLNGFGVGGPGMIGEKSKDGEDLNRTAWKRFGRGGLVVVDMPGYGSGSRAEWGEAVTKYLQGRKQLRRTFMLVDAEHGMKRSDLEMLGFLHSNGVAYQIVLSKVDKLLMKHGKMPSEIVMDTRLQSLQTTCDKIREDLNESLRQLAEERSGLRGIAGRPVMLDVLCCSAEKCLDGRRRIGINELRWAVMGACGIRSDNL